MDATELLTLLAIVIGLLAIGGVALLTRGRSRQRDDRRGGTATAEPEAPAPPVPDEAAPEAPTDTTAPPEAEVRPEAEAPAEPAAAPPVSPAERFRERLGRARSSLGTSVAAIFGRGLTDEAWDELEEALISADVGVEATTELVERIRERTRAEGIRTGDEALELLKQELRAELATGDRTLARREDGPSVWLVTGVNGTGKTTSIGKLAARHTRDGEQVVLAAADTFRAAAADQLERWGETADARVVRAGEGADPASVAFDGFASARASGAGLLLIDTAGRLQNKTALMEELRKVKRVVEREAGPCDEVLLVLDATVGQNGLQQARAFLEAVDVTGVMLTKLDGTARGGIVVAIQRELGIPVKLVGLGETVDDLAPFDPEAFVDALFAEVAQDVTLGDEEG